MLQSIVHFRHIFNLPSAADFVAAFV